MCLLRCVCGLLQCPGVTQGPRGVGSDGLCDEDIERRSGEKAAVDYLQA